MSFKNKQYKYSYWSATLDDMIMFYWRIPSR